MRHVLGAHYFYRHQRSSLQMPHWRTLAFGGNPLSEEEVDRLQEKLLIFLKERDRVHMFLVDFLVNDNGVADPNGPILFNLFAVIEVLHFRGSNELVEGLFVQFLLTTRRPSRREDCLVLGSRACLFPKIVAVNPNSPCIYLSVFETITIYRIFPGTLSCIVSWVKAQKLNSIAIEDGGKQSWLFLRTYEKDCICSGVLNTYEGT